MGNQYFKVVNESKVLFEKQIKENVKIPQIMYKQIETPTSLIQNLKQYSEACKFNKNEHLFCRGTTIIKDKDDVVKYIIYSPMKCFNYHEIELYFNIHPNKIFANKKLYTLQHQVHLILII